MGECAGGTKETLEGIRKLGVKIQFNADKDPAACREGLERLQQEHPKFRLTSVGNTFGPAWAVLLHIGIDVVNILNFIKTEDTARALLLAFTILISVCFANNLTTGGFFSIYHETKLSWDRGLFTDDYLKFITADKGIQAIPSLLIIVSGLPLHASHATKTLGGLGSILINVVLVVPFIYEQFDLGLVKMMRNLEADSHEKY